MPLLRQAWGCPRLTLISNSSIRSILRPFSLSESDLRSILNQPNQFLASPLDNRKAEEIRRGLILAYRKGFRVAFIVGGTLAAQATILTNFLMPRVPLDRPDEEQLKEEGRQVTQEK